MDKKFELDDNLLEQATGGAVSFQDDSFSLLLTADSGVDQILGLVRAARPGYSPEQAYAAAIHISLCYQQHGEGLYLVSTASGNQGTVEVSYAQGPDLNRQFRL